MGTFRAATDERNGYKVKVTKLTDDKVKVATEGSLGTTFETTIKAGGQRNYSGSAEGFSVSFHFYGGARSLNYKKTEEFFMGDKQ